MVIVNVAPVAAVACTTGGALLDAADGVAQAPLAD
jgi:hypothetical protein